jgi:hypothetical protein
MNAILTRLLPALLGSALPVFADHGPLLWSDDFNQPVNSAPDPAKWTYDLGGGGWGNNELETYTSARANSYIADDPDADDGRALVLRALTRMHHTSRQLTTACHSERSEESSAIFACGRATGFFATLRMTKACDACRLKTSTGAFTSARLKSLGLFSVRRGRIEARIKAAGGQGLWNAFWLLGDAIRTAGWPACGEIDVVEIINARPAIAHGTLHGPGYSGSQGITGSFTLPDRATFDSAYHVFAVDWTPEKIAWSVDGKIYHTVTPASLPAGAPWVFADRGFHLLLDLAVGGNWPGDPDATTVFPGEMRIDYVRVFAPSSEN